MRLDRLYVKIFLSFLLLLIVAQVLTFAFYLLAPEKTFRHRVDQHLRAYARVAREMVEGNIRASPGTAPLENESLKEALVSLARALEAKVWLAAPDGTPLLKSFQAEIPDTLLRMEARPFKETEGVRIFLGLKKRYEFHVVIPVEIAPGKTGSLHIILEKSKERHPGVIFALGLLGIGIILALLIIPVSRLITKRVTELRRSALRISEGDFRYRAAVKGNDEIGELGRTFNVMAEKVEKMIRAGKELTANVSHELRSPLARIRLAEELLREKLPKADPASYEENLNDIREDIEEMDRLIGRILELSKLDLHERALKIEGFDPSVMMDDLLERFRPILNQKNITVQKVMSYDGPFSGDKEGLRTAWSNVLDNAAKFIPERGCLIVKMHSEGPSLLISITNTFQAVPEEDLARIFEPFIRAERSYGTGYGLGLAIAKKIIEKHGGEIGAFNAPEGFEIQIRLPISC